MLIVCLGKGLLLSYVSKFCAQHKLQDGRLGKLLLHKAHARAHNLAGDQKLKGNQKTEEKDKLKCTEGEEHRRGPRIVKQMQTNKERRKNKDSNT